MKITILGTSSMVPTKERNVSAAFLEYNGTGFLFDCGEGTQRQMNITGIKRTSVSKIFITHWHADHIAGLLGLVQTLSFESKKMDGKKVSIYGPKDSKKHFQSLMDASFFDDTGLDIEVVELNPGEKPETFVETEEYIIQCAKTDHGIPSMAFAFVEKDKIVIKKSFLEANKISTGPHLKKLKEGKDIEYKGKEINWKEATKTIKGKKFAYILDTKLCNGAINIAKDADLVLVEATYKDDLHDKSEQNRHMTTKDVGFIANTANVKKVLITHFSQRYTNIHEIEENARKYFDNVEAAKDFMKITL